LLHSSQEQQVPVVGRRIDLRGPLPVTAADHVALSQGAGGPGMRRLVEEVFLPGLVDVPVDGVGLAALDDGAALRLGDGWVVMTTGSHVVQPAFFPGGDIGRLAICATVNNLAMMGATSVLGLACAVVLENGFPRADLVRIQASLRDACLEAAAPVVTGDTKVMGKGEIDGVLLTTTGVALTRHVVRDSALRAGDSLIVTGTVGDHGFAVLARRHGLELEREPRSDVAPLNGLVRTALEAGAYDICALKDPTRGGIAGVLHEMAAKSGVGIVLEELKVPVSDEVRAAAELLGIDPLTVANEGKAVVGVRPWAARAVLAAVRAHPLGHRAEIVGTCVAESPGSVVLDTGSGRRLLPEPDGDLLPRIC
jgi:hydrogenase expression/formation protein HypE